MGIYGGVFCGLDGRKRKEERMFWKNINIASLGIYLPFLDFSFSSAFFSKNKTTVQNKNKTKKQKKEKMRLEYLVPEDDLFIFCRGNTMP